MANWDRPVFENALLGLLYQGPRHGYEICQHIGPGGDWAAVGVLPRSQVYALLKALEGRGLAEASLQEGEGGGPARRVYVSTRAGREAFLAWVRQPVHSVRGLRVEFLLKLFFFRQLGLGGLGELLDAQAALLQARGREILEARTGASEPSASVLELQEALLGAALGWLERQQAKEMTG